MINIKMQPTTVQKLAPKIAVIGVGGAGGNAVNNMISSNLEGCEFIVCNTDSQALGHSLSETTIQLGEHVTGGLGAGSKPEIGKAAAEESLEEVLQYLDGANMAFVTAGMGGGTGTGAAPVISKACRERGILTIGVVTKPFHFEGTHRMTMAEAGIKEMQGYVDTLIVIPNQNLFRVANEKTTFAEAFKLADSVLQSGVRGVTDLMVRPGLVNLDFADIRTAMMEMGKAMMGTGEATGDKRAVEAAEAAINNPLLDDVSMKGARGVIINVTGGYDMTLFEADEACNRIRDEVDPNANIIFGATFDESIEGSMRVSIVATGIDREAAQKTKGGGGQVGLQRKPSVERAQPQTVQNTQNTAEQTQTPADLNRSIPATAPAASFVPAQNIRGITAPTRPVAPQQDVAATAAPSEPEQDLFEQQGFSVPSNTVQQEAVQPKNTALRGERYKNAFIPPKPVTPFHEAGGAAQANAGGLQLNPPKVPTPEAEKPRGRSLLDRIAGTVQQHIENVIDPQPHMQPAPPPQRQGQVAVEAAVSQGSLNIESPAAEPKAQKEDELDIPAFLRRQAN